ncbi:TNF receptor-associated factor 6-like isoform X1 [Oculina patagonica]
MAEGRGIFIPVGYDEAFVNPLDDDFTCLICHLAIREPVLTRCGHRFCRQCLEQCFTWQNGQRQSCPCPIDRADLVFEKDVFPDKATERKILSLVIKCPSTECNWTGELRQKQNHLSSCPYKVVHCTNDNCKDVILRKDLDRHVGSLCKWRVMLCTHCSEPHPKCQEEKHYKECKKYQVECPYGCGAAMQREKLPHHTGELCKLSEILCPYYTMGCNVMVKREQLESHLDAAARRHLDLACVKLNTNQEEFKETTRKLECKIEAMEKKLDSQKQLTANLGTKLDGEVLKLKEKSPPYMWKIEGFNEILRDAKRGWDTEIESGYFFTGPNGYKLMVRMYPNGNGAGKNTHISVYLCILRGKYDAALPWPFRKTVTLNLIDQHENTKRRQNYVQKVSCDGWSDAFARPVTDSNNGYGCPTFISHEELRRRPYIVDDTLFLQVQIGPPS